MPIMVIFSVLLTVSSQADDKIHPDKPSREKLKEKADHVIALKDNITAHKRIQDVWNWVDQLSLSGKTDEMESYLEFGLQNDPWAMKYQLLYAEILQKKGQKEKAFERANLVFRYAETDPLICRACKLLDKETCKDIPAISAIHTDEHSLVIVPIGQIDTWLVWRLQSSLQEILGIPVYVQDASITLSNHKRDRLKSFITHMRTTMISNIDTPEVKECLAKLNLDKNDLLKNDVVLNVMRYQVKKENNKEAIDSFERFVKEAEISDKQWDIDDLLKSLRKAVRPYQTSKVGFLGVTRADCFSNNNNFIFGIAQSKSKRAVISYARFRAEFNGETPNADRLFQRTLKQALSSIGFMYGLPRCSMPTCARSYPNSLAQHDAKSATLCPGCKEGLDTLVHGNTKKKKPAIF